MNSCTVHWEAAAPRADHSRCDDQVREVAAYHVSKGYNGIAYNWLVCIHGGIFEGRGWSRPSGANGTSASNLNSWAVCLMTGPGQAHTPEMRSALASIVTEALNRATGRSVYPHSHWVATACCGDIGRAWVREGLDGGGGVPPAPIIQTEDGFMKVCKVSGSTNGFCMLLANGSWYDMTAEYAYKWNGQAATFSKAEFDAVAQALKDTWAA